MPFIKLFHNYKYYAPLSHPRSGIRGHIPNTLDLNKFCAYHQSTGHNTIQCRDLLKQLRKLFDEGRLDGLVTRPEPCVEMPNDRERCRDENPRPVAKIEQQWPEGSDDSMPSVNQGERVNKLQSGGNLGRLTPVLTLQNKKRKAELWTFEVVHMVAAPKTTIGRNVTITFSNKDMEGIRCPKSDALVISANVLGWIVDRILVDNGSFCNIIYKSAMDQLGNLAKFVKPFDTMLRGFGDNTVLAYGRIKLPVELICCLDPEPSDSLQTSFSGALSGKTAKDIEPQIDFEPSLDLDPRIESSYHLRRDATTPIEELEKVQLDLAHPELEAQIGTTVPSALKGKLVELLRKNTGSFAWSHQDMVGISPEHVCHHLKIYPARKPVH
ncbi:hypothetical protein OROGR_001569 [Orobanche gracilis]